MSAPTTSKVNVRRCCAPLDLYAPGDVVSYDRGLNTATVDSVGTQPDPDGHLTITVRVGQDLLSQHACDLRPGGGRR